METVLAGIIIYVIMAIVMALVFKFSVKNGRIARLLNFCLFAWASIMSIYLIRNFESLVASDITLSVILREGVTNILFPAWAYVIYFNVKKQLS
jgi:hypothetical protein